MKNKFANVAHSRNDDQKGVMEKIISEGHCPFCRENIEKYHKQPVIKEGVHWIVSRNQWPYEGTKEHFIAVAQEHILKLDEMPEGAGDELFRILGELVRENKILGGGMFVRFGEMDRTGATVQHLHAQLVAGTSRLNDAGEQNEKLKVTLGYKASLPNT